MRVAGIIILSLIPCFWLQRIQAGDLASHVYNAWLTQLIEAGQAPGLFLASQRTNVLYDQILLGLSRWLPLPTATQAATAGVVLVFVFGALRFLRQAIGATTAVSLLPVILMLAYGWTFHQGLLNFHLALGIVLWAMALIWKQRTWRRVAGVGVLALLAATANPLPVLWGIACIGFVEVASRLPALGRVALAVVAVCATALLLYVVPILKVVWTPPLMLIVPADQFFVYGIKYMAIVLGMTVFWALALLRLSHLKGKDFFLQPPALLFATCLAVTFLLPSKMPWGNAPGPIAGVHERMTLPLAIALLLVIGQAPLERWQQAIQICLAALFFSFLYVDNRALDRIESQMESLLANLKSSDRLISSVDGGGQVRAPYQMAARAAVGRCWFYSNYEPAIGHFRVRCQPGNRITICSWPDKLALELREKYYVKLGEAPLYHLTYCGKELCIQRLEAGAEVRFEPHPNPLPAWW